jgi:glycosyltransferase involved in cell wall biosynthesis
MSSSKRILLYYPPNKRSVAIETLCKAVKEAGHELIVLTLMERGPFHEAVEKMGIQAFSFVLPRKPTWKYIVRHIRYLVSFCKQHNIDAVWSHLQEANIVAVLAQPFLKANVIAFRHHAESAFYAEYGEQFGMVRNKNEIRYDNLINRLAKKIVIPSSGVWYSMEKYEGCNMKKVILAPYIYDFSDYAKPDLQQVKKLRDEYSCHLLLIMVSRMIQSKQHLAVFEIVNKLKQEGLSVKMIVMDDGSLREQLEQYIRDNALQSDIFMVGFRSDFINYMDASDLLAHPSLTEASNNVAKELGLLGKTVAVCKDVGDFNDYIEEGRNGFFIDRKSLKPSLEEIIRKAYQNKDSLAMMGKELRKDVLKLFSDTPENRKRFIDLI